MLKEAKNLGLLEPKEFKLELTGGGERIYIISKFPAMDGLEIVSSLPMNAMGSFKDFDWLKFQPIVEKVMSYVAAQNPDRDLTRLVNKDLINNHFPPCWEDIFKVLIAMTEYNCSFFQRGLFLTLRERVTQNLPQLATKIFTLFSEQLSAQEKQTSRN
jgi:hypothetical protein